MGPLLQRAVDRGELGIQGGAEPIDHGDDRQRDARSDQAVFDRGCTCFIGQETLDVMLQLRLQVTFPPNPLGARITTERDLKLHEAGTRNAAGKYLPITVQI